MKAQVAADDEMVKSMRGLTIASMALAYLRPVNAPATMPGSTHRNRSISTTFSDPEASNATSDSAELNNKKRGNVDRTASIRLLFAITTISGGPLTADVVPQKPHKKPATATLACVNLISTLQIAKAEIPTSTVPVISPGEAGPNDVKTSTPSNVPGNAAAHARRSVPVSTSSRLIDDNPSTSVVWHRSRGPGTNIGATHNNKGRTRRFMPKPVTVCTDAPKARIMFVNMSALGVIVGYMHKLKLKF